MIARLLAAVTLLLPACVPATEAATPLAMACSAATPLLSPQRLVRCENAEVVCYVTASTTTNTNCYWKALKP